MSTFPIITKLGGRDAVHQKLSALGFDHSIHALRMWESRGSLPGDAIVLLLKIAEAEQVEIASSDLEARPDAKAERAA